MESSGFKQDAYQLIKRRGWLFIEIDEACYFSFFHKKETMLDPENKGWIFEEKFTIRASDYPKVVVERWEETLQQLENWLMQQDKG